MNIKKRLAAVIMALMMIASTSAVSLTANATTNSKTVTSISTNKIAREEMQQRYEFKALIASVTKGFYTMPANKKLALIAKSQVGNTAAGSLIYTGKSYFMDYSGAFINWCITASGVSNKYLDDSYRRTFSVSPIDQQFKPGIVTFTKAANNRLSEKFISAYARKAANRNVSAASINYQVGDIVYFGRHSSSSKYYFSYAGIVTDVSKNSNGVRTITVVVGNSTNGGVVTHKYTINKSFDNGNLVVMARVAARK